MRPASYVPGELIPLPLSGSIPELPHVAKVFLAWRLEIPKVADALHARRGKGPYRFIVLTGESRKQDASDVTFGKFPSFGLEVGTFV